VKCIPDHSLGPPKVRIVYDRRAKVIVTVLPLKLDPNRPRRLKTLTV
jgi:hypothetical protein